MINFDTYKQLYFEAKEYSDIDMYITERGWQEWMNDIPEADIASFLTDVYTFSNKGIEGILEVYACTLKAFSDRHCIPYKTVQKWKNKDRETSEYSILHISYAVLLNMYHTTREELRG